MVGRDREEIAVNSTGNPHWRRVAAGLLAGFLAGLLAQPELQQDGRTLQYAVWQHGLADSLQESKPNWTVEELADVLGAARGKGSESAIYGQFCFPSGRGFVFTSDDSPVCFDDGLHGCVRGHGLRTSVVPRC